MWTDEIISDLKRMVTAGQSGSEIARALNIQYGRSFTRNSVIGKIHRLSRKGTNLPRAHKHVKATMAPKKKQEIRSRRMKMPPTLRAVVSNETVPEAPPANPKSLFELEANDCRWPYGDGPFFFCGGAKEMPGMHAYCAHHAAIAFVHGRRQNRSKQHEQQQRQIIR